MVCAGNICRSPTAEYIMKKILMENGKNISVSSAGLVGLYDHPIERNALDLLNLNSIDASHHKGRKLNSDLVNNNEILLVMENRQIEDLCSQYPHARGKTFLLGKWNDGQEIPDPYRQSKEAFEYVYKLIEIGCNAWNQHL